MSEAERVSKNEGQRDFDIENYGIDNLTQQPWEETLEVLTADMDPHNIDLKVLTGRYREYIEEMQDFEMAVPARAIRLLSALLKFKTLALAGEEENGKEDENPMDFDEPMMEEKGGEKDQPDLRVGPDLEMPVKARPKRRMSLEDLTEALEDALEVKEKREERQELREEMDDPIDMDERSLQDKINSLYSRLSGLVSRNKSDEIPFESLLDQEENEEMIEKFLHVLHLENEQKVDCIQDEWLGDLRVKPQEEPDEVAN